MCYGISLYFMKSLWHATSSTHLPSKEPLCSIRSFMFSIKPICSLWSLTFPMLLLFPIMLHWATFLFMMALVFPKWHSCSKSYIHIHVVVYMLLQACLLSVCCGPFAIVALQINQLTCWCTHGLINKFIKTIMIANLVHQLPLYNNSQTSTNVWYYLNPTLSPIYIFTANGPFHVLGLHCNVGYIQQPPIQTTKFQFYCNFVRHGQCSWISCQTCVWFSSFAFNGNGTHDECGIWSPCNDAVEYVCHKHLASTLMSQWLHP